QAVHLVVHRNDDRDHGVVRCPLSVVRRRSMGDGLNQYTTAAITASAAVHTTRSTHTACTACARASSCATPNKFCNSGTRKSVRKYSRTPRPPGSMMTNPATYDAPMIATTRPRNAQGTSRGGASMLANSTTARLPACSTQPQPVSASPSAYAAHG